MMGSGFNGFPIPPAPAGPGYNVRTPWVRPVDWLNLPELLSTDQKMVGLFAVWPGTGNVVAMTCRGAYTVNWGDGTTENVADNTLVNHTYDYADADLAGTECTRGYKQAIVTVTAQGGSNLTSIVLDVTPTVPTGVVAGTGTGWLDISISSSLLTTLTLFSTGNVRGYLLEKVTIVSHGLTSTASLFANCPKLQSVSNFSMAGITDATNMFSSCYSLQTVPLFNLASLVTATSMFANCYSLQTVPLWNLSSLVTASSMFSACYSLQTVPLFNLSSLVTATSMFANCRSLQTVPLWNLASLVTATSMFSNCYSLQTVPLFNLSSLVTATSMFSSCYSLQTVPLWNLAALVTADTMFYSCLSLQTVPLWNLAALVTADSMFSACYGLQTVPLWNLSSLVTASSMFANCYGLQTVPLFNLAALVTADSMFVTCRTLQYLPTLSASKVTTAAKLATIVGTCPSLMAMVLSGAKYAFSIDSCRFASTAIEALMDGLGAGVSSPALTITNNIGAPTEVTKANSGTTSGSATVTLADTSTLAVGMEVRGTGISDAVAVTMQDAGDTVTRVAHGIPDGTRVSFATIVTTTGIVVNTPYYVVNGAADTFQVSDTLGGGAKALTTNGTGTVVYGTTISAINPNVSFTLSTPASATGTVTTYSAVLKRSKARLHGFTVAG